MDIMLTWDLFIVVFFTVIVAYSFIVGRNQTLKIIISSYIAILAADGLGNLARDYLFSRTPIIKIFSASGGSQALLILKIGIFVSTIVLLATRGGFQIDIMKDKSKIISIISTSIFGILSAGLIVSTMLIYVSGLSLVEGADISNSTIFTIYQQSYFIRSMINNYNIWFSLPALAFITTSLINSESNA